MENNTGNWKMQEIENRAKARLGSMSKEEIDSTASKYKKSTNITLAIFGSICLICLVVLIVISINPKSWGEKPPIGSIIIVFLILGFAAIFPFIMMFYINRKSIEELALLQIKFEIRKSISKLSNEQVIDAMSNGDFAVSKTISIAASGRSSSKLLIDNEHKLFIYQQGNSLSKTYHFSDLINYEVYENGQSKVKGRAGSALIGGAFFGLTGLIVGSSMSRKIEDKCNQLKLMIRLNDLDHPQIVITYVDNVAWDKTGFTYRTMKENLQQVCAALEYIMNAKTLEQAAAERPETQLLKEVKPLKEQLQELKEMLDSGLITQEEYEQKKKLLLNL